MHTEYKIKANRTKTFGKRIGQSDLVNTLLLTHRVFIIRDDFSKEPTLSHIKGVRKKIKKILDSLEKRGNQTKDDMYEFFELKLAHEQYLMIGLVDYLENTPRVKENLVKETLTKINDSMEKP